MTDRVVTKAEWDALAEWMDTIEAAILTLKASALSYKGTWSGSAVTYRMPSLGTAPSGSAERRRRTRAPAPTPGIGRWRRNHAEA
jgi:hypothetical protein